LQRTFPCDCRDNRAATAVRWHRQGLSPPQREQIIVRDSPWQQRGQSFSNIIAFNYLQNYSVDFPASPAKDNRHHQPR
jgi:hypothetical protein